jgi:hypothetical protein
MPPLPSSVDAPGAIGRYRSHWTSTARGGPVNFGLEDHHVLIRDTIRDFATREIGAGVER